MSNSSYHQIIIASTSTSSLNNPTNNSIAENIELSLLPTTNTDNLRIPPDTASTSYSNSTVTASTSDLNSTATASTSDLNSAATASTSYSNSTVTASTSYSNSTVTASTSDLNSTATASTSDLNSAATAAASKSAALNAKYRVILENLLRLKQELVTSSIKQAIKAILLNHKTATSADWIRVIFRSFELILNTEEYLNECLSFLANIIETGHILEIIKDKEIKNEFKVHNRKMTTILNAVSAEAIYKHANTVFVADDRAAFVNVLGLLGKSLSVLQPIHRNALSPDQIRIWYKHIIPLVFDTNLQIQEAAIRAVAKVIPFLLISRHQSHEDWSDLKEIILDSYTKNIFALFIQNSAKWHILWCYFLRLMDIDIPRSASTLNAFLTIVEPALRSSVPTRRAEGYLCWRVLLEVLVRHNRLDTPKRLKLVCTPLKSLQARTLEIALNKFHAWWYVICHTRDNLDVYIEMVLEPFLQFSFGPLQTRPAIRPIVADAAAQVKRFKNVSIMAVVGLIRMLGQTGIEIDAVSIKYGIDRLNRNVVNNRIFQNDLAMRIINACGEATQMLFNLANDENEIDPAKVTVLGITEKLWSNLLQHINVSRNIQHIYLILENFKQLVANANNSKVNKNYQIDIALTAANIVVKSAYLFLSNESDPDMIEKRIKMAVAYIKLTDLLSYPDERIDEFLHNVLIICDTDPNVDNNILIFYINEMFNGIFIPALENRSANTKNYLIHRNFRVWTELATDISNWYKKNFASIKELDKDDLTCVIDVTYNFLFWPLRTMIDAQEIEIFNKHMIVFANYLVALTSKKAMCLQSSDIVRNIMDGVTYCSGINRVVAKLIEYMDYDFTDINDAPVEIFDLAKMVIEKKEITGFQDLNGVIAAIITCCKNMDKEELAIMRKKLKKILSLIKSTKSETRINSAYLSEFSNLVKQDVKLPTENQKNVVKIVPKSSPNANANVIPNTVYVIMDKKWTFKPNHLTEHQREKMKERRCDIPALYNDLSQSQDTATIPEWAPKVIVVPKDLEKTADKVEATIEAKSEIQGKKKVNTEINRLPNGVETQKDVDEKEVTPELSFDSDKKVKKSDSLSSTSNNESLKVNGKSPNKKRKAEGPEEKPAEDDKNISKRVARELSRIHIDTIEMSPSVETNGRRNTRSATKALPEDDRRRTRSSEKLESNKAINTSISQQKTSPKTRAQTSNAKSSSPNSDSVSIDEISSSQIKTETPSRGTPMSLRTRRHSVCSRAYGYNISENIAESEPKRTRRSVLPTQEEPNKSPIETKRQNKNKQEETKVNEKKPKPVEQSSPNKREGKKSKDVTMEKMNGDKKGEKKENVKEEKEEKKKIQTENKNEDKTEEQKETKKKENIEGKREGTKAEKSEDTNEIKKSSKTKIIKNFNKFEADNKLNLEPVIVLEKSSINSIECPAPAVMNSPLSHVIGTRRIEQIMQAYVPRKKLSNEESPIKCLSEISAKTEQFLSPPQNKSYMSTLMYDDNSLHAPDVSMNQSILTSPRVDHQRNLDFLNDTLNISPIPTDDHEHATNGENEIETERDEPVPAATTQLNGDIQTAELCQSPNVRDLNLPVSIETTNTGSKLVNASTTATTPIVTTPMPSKQYRSSMHASTPLASNHSPISSKLRSSLTGRGAQLLNMINSNKAASDVGSPSTSSSTINQLPLHLFDLDLDIPPNQPTNSAINRINCNDYLTFSSVLPSPHENPGISILKRKANHESDDDSISSPAHKRKRVSFNFPLSVTKEYIIEEVDTTPTRPKKSSRRGKSSQYNSPAHRLRSKFKRKNRSDSMKDISKFYDTSKSLEHENYTSHDIIIDADEDEVSVDHIKLFLEIDRQNMETIEIDDDEDDQPEESQLSPTPPEPVTLSSFSDEEVLEHIFNRYSIDEVLQQYEDSNRTYESPAIEFLTNKLSTMMSIDENVQSFVLSELAEQHTDEFLEHALTENLCPKVCSHLSETYENGVVEFMADKMNNDKRFSTLVLNQLKPDVIMKHISNELDIQDQQKLSEQLFNIVNAYHKSKQPIYKLMKQKLPEHLHKIIVKILSENRLSVDQFEEYNKLYILKKFSKETT